MNRTIPSFTSFLTSFLPLLVAMLTLPQGAQATPSACDQLDGEPKSVADAVLQSEHSYQCCSDTIAQCLIAKPACALSQRLANRVCTLAAKGETEEKIRKRLQKRAQSVDPKSPVARIDPANFPVAGNPNAPITTVVYACTRCPFCSKLVPQLYTEVTTGRLKDKVKLYLKPFPLKSHALSKEGGLALVAAGRLGKFWEYSLLLYRNFNQFSVAKLSDWAVEAGLSKDTFSQKMTEQDTVTALVNSKKEGLENGVNATPQIFIDGRKYSGFLDIDELVDTMLGEAERSTP